jgi:thioesterase-3
MPMKNAAFDYQFLVRECHLDTFGHVNNATYFQLFEEARWDIISPRGYGLAEVQKRRKGPVILDAQIKFLKELKLREMITIRSVMLPFEGKVSKIKQTMLKPDGSLACEVSFTVGFFDLEARKLIPPSPEWLYAIGLSAE